MISTIINVAANIVYAYANAFPADKKWALLVSRAFVGFGAGEGVHQMNASESAFELGDLCAVFTNCRSV